MELLRIATAGSVDDGKSTLIGRLLYETKSLKDDQLDHIEEKSKAKGLDYTDFSLATDGLLTEREQGITIDVSHIYFNTPKRRFIIADSPGHVEYTRNMVTGASNAEVAIILLDARKGVIEQTQRHYSITRLMGIEKVIFAINKIDLIDYDEGQFEAIIASIKSLIAQTSTAPKEIHYIPLSALNGDNIVRASQETPYYNGPSLLELIHQLPIENSIHDENILQVQYVIRPQLEAYHDYRGFAGKVRSGQFKIGDEVEVFPTGLKARIKEIEKYGEATSTIREGENATLLLDKEIDISRGNAIVGVNSPIEQTKTITATICWMQVDKLAAGKKYWVQIGAQKIQAKITNVVEKIQLSQKGNISAELLELNDIGTANIQLAQPILALTFSQNKQLGVFILIDPLINNTAGIGFTQSA
ncbi:GTP-binding protein [Flavobacteriaceae bacterium]|nr:GTP-binding protein [Flavobacteriaceae bacterium]MDB4117972.1 GTP-binding protein [Flavobacteriaceae bacterium]